ncbi:MAG: hypothetical protein DHS20C21_19600 [Gemmatimonadota bacterium]|nr:MAG: hypothetical protein DHS20C21_19600 [Gemmatimonadota bacterium]
MVGARARIAGLWLMRVLVAGVSAVTAQADALRVPEDYSSVLAAVDAAVSGDSVLVGPGTWSDLDTRTVLVCGGPFISTSAAFLKPGLTLIGVDGPTSTHLVGSVGGAGVTSFTLIAADVGDPIRVQGFSITSGEVGAAVGCASDLVFSDCHFVDCGEEAIAMKQTAISLDDCLVSGNQGSGFASGAIAASFSSDLTVRNTRFESNPRGAVSANDPARILIEGCEFVDHLVRRPVTVQKCNNVMIRDSLFLRNRTTGTNISGAAIQLGSFSVGTIEFNTFAYDSALASSGAAVHVSSSWATVRGNTFYRCYTPGVGAAVYVTGTATVNCQNNIVVECDGYALSSSSGTVLPQSGCNILWNNTEDYWQWPDEVAATDIPADPLFCDSESLDFTVGSSSPALSENSPACGPIGAHPQGCGTVAIEPTTWGRLKSLYREP